MLPPGSIGQSPPQLVSSAPLAGIRPENWGANAQLPPGFNPFPVPSGMQNAQLPFSPIPNINLSGLGDIWKGIYNFNPGGIFNYSLGQ
jgi:hypothetical protein